MFLFLQGRRQEADQLARLGGQHHYARGMYFNTKIALNAWVLYLASVPRRRAENSAFHLPAHHVTSPDTSRGETQHARLKSVQSQNAPSLFPCAKSLRRRISSQIGWLTQNSELSSQPADPRDGAREGLDAPAHRSAPGLSSPTRSGQRQVDISRQLWSRHRLQAANYKDRGTRLHRPVVVASPAGRTGLREARAAPDRAPAVLLDSL